MEFCNGEQLLSLCSEKTLPISEVMRNREIVVGGASAEEITIKLERVIEIMEQSTHSPLEKPQKSIGVSNAFTCAQLALSGVTHQIPFDEMTEAMYKVGCSIPFELRETAMGGNAGTPTGCTLCR